MPYTNICSLSTAQSGIDFVNHKLWFKTTVPRTVPGIAVFARIDPMIN